MSGTTMIILSAFVVYLLFMIVIGVVYMKKTNSSEDYFLGGRGLNAWVAALSAQASDLDRSRSVYRNSIKLGLYFTQTS